MPHFGHPIPFISLHPLVQRRRASASPLQPRLKPPGYTPHWVLLIMHLFFPTGSPMVYGVLFSTFVCEKIEDEWVARVDHSLHCYKVFCCLNGFPVVLVLC